MPEATEKARDLLPRGLQPHFNALLEQYKFHAALHVGIKIAHPAILAGLVRDGWRDSDILIDQIAKAIERRGQLVRELNTPIPMIPVSEAINLSRGIARRGCTRHSDPDNTGQCITCGTVLDSTDPDYVELDG